MALLSEINRARHLAGLQPLSEAQAALFEAKGLHPLSFMKSFKQKYDVSMTNEQRNGYLNAEVKGFRISAHYGLEPTVITSVEIWDGKKKVDEIKNPMSLPEVWSTLDAAMKK